ncbi:MAG TPA: 4-hydroxy-tetrahydrodipicolinate reductase [bacterium]|nr:4-hydroxy-tetrahydrodipicolinate reductase [bacterium]
MSVKVAVSGAVGRMGTRIIANILANPDFELVGALESPGDSALGKDAGLVAGAGESGVKITDSLDAVMARADVLIDFTAPQTTIPHLEIVAKHGKAAVIGSTGHAAEEKDAIASLAKRLPFVMASNMSVGVNVLWKIVADAAKLLGPGFDVEIVEAHHRLKKDAPSGTAMTTAEVLAKALGRDLAKDAVYHREGMIGARKASEIGIQTIRGGDVVGDHTVFFLGGGERLEVTHRATSRDTFALGSLRAAQWIVGKPNGLYSMADVLGLK